MLSRRAVLEEERKEQRQEILDRLQPGLIVEGQISNIVDFGAFVDLNGIDGLIHISELSWSHVNHPSEILNIGDTVQVKVLDIDRDRQRISLGLKQTQEDPWQRVVDTYTVGDELEGTVTKVVTFGAFVEILDGVEGLVHISELAAHHVENPREVVPPGDEVKVKILEIDSERRRLSLSRQARRGPGAADPLDRGRRRRPRRHARARACPRTCSPEPRRPAPRGRRGGRGRGRRGRGRGRAEAAEAEAEAAEAPEAAAEEPERRAAESPRRRRRRSPRRRPAAESPRLRPSRGGREPRPRQPADDESAAPGRPPFVGLTGGIGAGKSEALAALERLGAATLSTDAVVHELYADPEVVARGREPLGRRGRRPTASVDRAAVARRAFADRRGRAWLEGAAVAARRRSASPTG